MTHLFESLEDLARDGETRYSRATPSADAGLLLAREVRRTIIRRRSAVTGLWVAGALAVATAVIHLAPPRVADPARHALTSVAGTEVWWVDLDSEMWAAPAIAGDVVIAGANDGVLRAVDLSSGEVVWEVGTRGALRGPITVADDVAYALSDDGFLYAVGVDGVQLWATDVGSVPGAARVDDQYSSGALVVDGTVYIGSYDGNVYALAADTGLVQWTFETGAPVSATPAFADGVVYVGGHDRQFYALDAATGSERWRRTLAGRAFSAPAVSDGVVIAGSHGTSVLGLDAETGDALWSILMPNGGWAEASPSIVDGVAYFGSSNSGLITAANVATGGVIWQVDVGGVPWARPVVAGESVYVATGWYDEIGGEFSALALDRSTGARHWSATTGPALDWDAYGPSYGAMASPAVTDRLVVVAGLDGFLRAYRR